MRKWSLYVVMLLLILPVTAFAAPKWQTVEEQIQKDKIQKGSKLEKLVRENQDFQLLREEEANDKIPVPAWLRVLYRKAHPEGDYNASDPMGGYPHVLKEVHEWMITHQDLEPGNATHSKRGDRVLSVVEEVTAGTNVRVSGAAANPRSESDIRVNYWDNTKIIGGSNNIGGNGQQLQFYSTDGGSTWGQTYLPLPTGSAFNSDPTVDWTSDGTAWSTTMGINSSVTQLRLYSFKSTNNGATWTLEGTI